MGMLRIDRQALAFEDPLLFRELQGRCTLCASKQRCMRDLASDPSGTSMDYCPNTGTLNLLRD
jgi:alpha-D-ribose 1-methylphosphonate 5-phosphate C-P lyase